jgi:hypothetical protein
MPVPHHATKSDPSPGRVAFPTRLPMRDIDMDVLILIWISWEQNGVYLYIYLYQLHNMIIWTCNYIYILGILCIYIYTYNKPLKYDFRFLPNMIWGLSRSPKTG